MKLRAKRLCHARFNKPRTSEEAEKVSSIFLYSSLVDYCAHFYYFNKNIVKIRIRVRVQSERIIFYELSRNEN